MWVTATGKGPRKMGVMDAATLSAPMLAETTGIQLFLLFFKWAEVTLVFSYFILQKVNWVFTNTGLLLYITAEKTLLHLSYGLMTDGQIFVLPHFLYKNTTKKQ